MTGKVTAHSVFNVKMLTVSLKIVPGVGYGFTD